MKPRTRAEAEAAGFVVDDCCYPPIAYKGPRFQPTEHHQILTDREAKLVAALQKINRAIYSVGAPLGSSKYFEIREIAVRTLRDVGEET